MPTRWTTCKSVVETVALVVVAIGVLWTAAESRSRLPNGPGPSRKAAPATPLPTEPISIDGIPTSGSRAAHVALIVYSDFQCPFCAKFAHEALPKIDHEYVQTGKVLVGFRQYPLPIHAFAEKAAEGSLCAARQGRFWPFHDALFANQRALGAPDLKNHAEHVGLDVDQFASCLTGQTVDQVQADKKSGQPLGVTGTPTFFAGRILSDGRVQLTERLSGALPIEQFRTVLDGLLTKSNAGLR